jgi:hypothetical protein
MYRLSDFWVMRSKALRLAAPQARRQREFQRRLQRLLRDAQNNANNQDDDNDGDHNDDNNDDDNNDDSNGHGKPRVDPDEAARRQRALNYLHNESRCLQTQDNNDPAEHNRVQRLILQEMMRVEAHGSISLNNHNHNGNDDVDDQDDVEAGGDENNDENNNIVVDTEQQRQQYEAIAAALGFTTPRTLSQKTLLQRVIAWCESKK